MPRAPQPRTVLHVLAQRPSHTGSGTTLQALVRHAAEAGYRQAVVAGTSAADPHPVIEPLEAAQIYPLPFGEPPLDFPLPGMSDVMPYRSSRYSVLTPAQLAGYREAWRSHLTQVIDRTGPDVVHCHHLWLVSALLKDLYPELPVVNHCHATGLRQLDLCPHLADEVRAGAARHERYAALTRAQGKQLGATLGVDEARIGVVGAGYRDELFHARSRPPEIGPSLLYAGKLAHAKGLPWLLDAVAEQARDRPGLTLHIAGAGAGQEADALRERIASMAGLVRFHGQVDQPALAELMSQATAFVLPSFYEGLPLVLIEALASGCRLISTALPVVTDDLAPHLGEALTVVPLPRLRSVDEPEPADLPAFTAALGRAITATLDAAPLGDPATNLPETLGRFTWRAVFERVEQLWQQAATQAGRWAPRSTTPHPRS